MGRSLSIITKSLLQLSLFDTINYLIYQIQLRSGFARMLTPKKSRNNQINADFLSPRWLGIFPEKDLPAINKSIQKQIIKEADKILSGKFDAFSKIEMALTFDIGKSLKHWSHPKMRMGFPSDEDIKFIWEPSRFNWSIRLGQAYVLTKDEKYANFFWTKYADFKRSNPLNCGPNWSSAQEVALRLIAWVITLNLLRTSDESCEINLREISADIADHADRIMATLSYAKAQNNNHLISEAVGLYTAGTFIGYHPRASKWRSLGKRLFEKAIKRQIDQNGEYIQHSTNYHRMMLALSLWMLILSRINDEIFSNDTTNKINNAIHWIWNMTDLQSGKVPNLGHNDGSLILPFSTADFSDFRPIIQAASKVFLGINLLPPGQFDDLALWLGIENNADDHSETKRKFRSPRIGNEESWGTLRSAQYTTRPAHADQLHVDLWYQGNNVLMDAGTYQYNACPPWDNGLSGTGVHNTVTLQKKDQMTKGGRFLWLDWAQAHVSEYKSRKIIAAHDGYLKMGAVHERALIQKTQTHWQVIDHIYKMKAAKNALIIDLHWLVPDWKHDVSAGKIIFYASFGTMQIKIQIKDRKGSIPITIYRAGQQEKTTGSGENHTFGWFSPTYGVKQPAVSVICSFNQKLPCTIKTDIIFSQT